MSISNEPMSQKNPYIRDSAVVLLLMSAPLVALYAVDFLYFHILIEAYAIGISATIFVIVLNTRQYLSNSFFVILGLSFLSITVIDFVHSLAYPGMNFKDLSKANTATSLWVLARYIHAVSFLVALKLTSKSLSFKALTVIYATVTVLSVLIVLNGYFPETYIEGQGQSTFKVLSEFIFITCYMTAFFVIDRYKSHFDTYTLKMLKIALVFCALSELCFALYIDVYSIVNAFGHFCKMAAFYFFYRACVYTTLNKPLESIFSEIDLNRKFLRNVIESLSNPFVVIDANDYTVKLANSSANKSALGPITCYELLQKSPTLCDENKITCPLKEVKKSKKPVVIEHEQVDEAGKRKVLQIYAYPVFDESGNVSEVIEYSYDITEQKKQIELITKLSLAIEQSSNSIIITDVNGIIEYVNHTFTEITGYLPDEVIGQKPSILKSGVNPPQIYVELWQTIKSGRTWKGRLCNKNKNGELFWEDLTITPLKNDKGEITHFVGICEDIQDKIRAEVAEQKAIEHERLINELQQELQSLEQVILTSQATFTARAYGNIPFKEAMPETFAVFVQEYAEMLERYIDVQIFKVDTDISETLKAFVEKIGMLKLNARDLIDIHTSALRLRTIDRQNPRTQAYKEEGRMMALEIMGYLANFYRNYFIMTAKNTN